MIRRLVPAALSAALAVLVLSTAACSAKTDAPAGGLQKTTASADYPLKTCVVSGEELGAMGDRVAYTYEGTEVQFCCPDCVKDFQKDPAKYIAQIQAAKK